MASQDELVRRELQLEWEIARHELECLDDDDAPCDQIDAKIAECELLMARQADMARPGCPAPPVRDHGDLNHG
jgi:hypothetical protein